MKTAPNIQAAVYSEITVLVDGALEEHEIFTDYALENEFITNLAREAQTDGVEMEVFRLVHEHHVGVEECSCVQYETSHHPTWSFPEDIGLFLDEPEDWQ